VSVHVSVRVGNAGQEVARRDVVISRRFPHDGRVDQLDPDTIGTYTVEATGGGSHLVVEIEHRLGDNQYALARKALEALEGPEDWARGAQPTAVPPAN
jgi:hypothetical protein